MSVILHSISVITTVQAALLVSCVASAAYSLDADDLSAQFTKQVQPFLKTYCIECHGGRKTKGDLNLKFKDAKTVLGLGHMWREAADRVHMDDMPPSDKAKQPSSEERAVFLTWVRDLKYLSPKDPGRNTIRRLSQVEYANTLRDLLGVDPSVASRIPVDLIGEGYNSSIPPLLMEQYFLVASDILDDAIAPDQLDIAWSAARLDAIINGKAVQPNPSGHERILTGPSEITVNFTAPTAGAYLFTIKAMAEKTEAKDRPILKLCVDTTVIGEVRVTPKWVNGSRPDIYRLKAKLPSGRMKLSLSLSNPDDDSEEPKPQNNDKEPKEKGKEKGEKKPKHPLRSVTVSEIAIKGPPGRRPTALQKQIFIATPSKNLSPRDAAKEIAVAFTRRAFRRPATHEEIEMLLKIFQLSHDQGDAFTLSVKFMLKAILLSPQFFYLTPDDDIAQGTKDEIVALGDYQLAQKLSYLLWSTMPDEELSRLADAGTLHKPVVLAAQAKRLLNDPRARSLFHGFGAPWLNLDRIAEFEIDEQKYPQLTPALRRAMYQEGELFFASILQENRSIIDFITGDYTFLNADLAKLYGMTGIKGSELKRTKLSDKNRGGIMTMPGVLMVTSMPSRTSPVKRGAWVLQEILGREQPTPPADVPPLDDEELSSESAGLNLRQRTERHRDDPACISCHQAIDPLGFGLENFDVLGRWRTKDDTNFPVDASGELPGKLHFRNPAQFKQAIASRRDDFTRGLVRKALAYALCRSLSDYDEVVADQITEAVINDGYRFQTMWISIVTSYPFTHRRVSRN